MLLDEAWRQLRAQGYGSFTIDAVARAAETSRAVLYRRWPNKASLVHAAIRAHTGSVVDEAPDTGALADDVRTVLRTLSGRIESLGVDVMIGLLGELDELPADVTGSVPRIIDQTVQRARARGEIGAAPIPSAVLDMPTNLLRYTMITEHAAPSDEAVDNIVDQLFIPLVRHYAPSGQAEPPAGPAEGQG